MHFNALSAGIRTTRLQVPFRHKRAALDEFETSVTVLSAARCRYGYPERTLADEFWIDVVWDHPGFKTFFEQ